MLKLFLFLLSVPLLNAAYIVTQVSYLDCRNAGTLCDYRIQDGDTTIFTAWSNAGTVVVDGVSKTGTVYGTTNDTNIYYNGGDATLGPNCSGRNIVWLSMPTLVTTNVVGASNHTVNCLTSFGATPSDRAWLPAASGTCSSGDTSGCDWKSQGNICVDGVCYLNVYRQERSDGLHIYRGHDSTLIKTSNGGITWLNPAHVGGTPNANGDAPAGPGDATYPSSMIWPDPVSHNGTDQKMARLMFIGYGADGATWPNVDGNSTYVYAISYDGSFSQYYLSRVIRANMANLSANDWSYYKCATYPTTICDGTSSGSWDSSMANATSIGAGFGLGGVLYSSELAIYIMVGGNVGTTVKVSTAPHPWGPWTISGTPSRNPIASANLGFTSPLMSTLKTVSAGRSIEFTTAVTEYNHAGSGSLGYVTYQIESDSATLSVSVSGVTNTQAVLSYTAPNTNACAVEVSESNTYSPVVYDVSETLFTSASSDGGGDVTRMFVVGKRLAATALDGNRYSRALQVFTTHYYRVTCGIAIATGSFKTANIPFGVTYQDEPQLSPTTGLNFNPTLSTSDRNQRIIDPRTGVEISRISLPADTASDGGGGTGPFLFFSGFVRVCTVILVGPDNGYLCSFPQGDGGDGSVYYIIPSTRVARYLGKWGGLSSLYVSPTDAKFYTMSGNDLVYRQYTGSYASATSGTNVSFSTSTVKTGIPAAIAAFDATFDTTKYGCSVGQVFGDYAQFQCKRNGQDTYGWIAIVKISTAAVIAATRVDANIQCRWCAIHQTIPMYDSAGIQIETHGLVGQSSPLGGGPYITLYAGGSIPVGTTSITVGGEPACVACGVDSEVPVARVGDMFRWSDNNETVKITTKTDSTHWIVTPTTLTHTTGATLMAECNYTPIYWKFLVDSHGTDTTNVNFVADQYWPGGGHDDMTTGLRMAESDGWTLKTGDLLSGVNTPLTRNITASPFFAGTRPHCFGNGCIRHPSVGVASGEWLTDFQGWDGSPYDATLSPVSGQLYKYNGNSWPIKPRYNAIGAADLAPFSSGPIPIVDMSGPGVTIGTTSADQYKYCYANAVNECHNPSVKGDLFVNLPGTPVNCSVNHACISNFNPLIGLLQVGLNGTQTRLISTGLVGLRDTNNFPTAKTLADGSGVLFTVGDTQNHPPSQLLLAKLPPFTASDSVDRSKFIGVSIPLTNPGGGATKAAIRFGYLERGTATDYKCTSRNEVCIANTNSTPPTDGTTDPFKYLTTDTWTGLTCTSTCSITLPVLPLHVVYYQPIWTDNSGTVVVTGTPAVTGDYVTTVTPPLTTGLHLLPTPISH